MEKVGTRPRYCILLSALQIALLGAYERPYLNHVRPPDSGQSDLPPRPQARCQKLDVFAHALYWQTTETVDWAYTVVINEDVQRVHFRTLDFDWDPGFRVGLGYNLEYDRWDTQLYYTWFHTRTKDHIDSGSGAVNAAFIGTRTAMIGIYQTAEMSWDLRFNMFDWELGRNFLISKYLSFRPLIGLKGGRIYQTIHTELQNPNFLDLELLLISTENLKNNFAGGGPKGGVQAKWMFGDIFKHFFSFFGDFTAVYMWGRWFIRSEFQDNLFYTTASTRVAGRTLGALALQGLIGIGWDFNFNQGLSHFALKLGYEIQDWFEQYRVLDSATGEHNSDLILQGLTLDVRLDF